MPASITSLPSLFSFGTRKRRLARRRRGIFNAQFDGQDRSLFMPTVQLGCDILEQRIVLSTSAGACAPTTPIPLPGPERPGPDRGETGAEGTETYFRPSRRLARLIDFASARCRRSSWRYMRTASGCDSFQTSGRSEW